jgi:hypothetical protein
MYSYVVAGAPVPDGTERGGVFLFSFYAGCRTKREAMRALRADWADGCACDGSGRRRRSSSKVFLTSRPGGTSGRLAETKTPALPASVGWVDASKPTTREAHASRGGSRGIDPPYIGPADRECACRRSRYRTVPLAVTSLRVRSRSARTFQFAIATSTDELRAELGDQA